MLVSINKKSFKKNFFKKMSEVTTKNKSFFSGVRVADFIGFGALGLSLFLWNNFTQEITKVNESIIKLTEFLKIVNKNVNLLDLQLTQQMYDNNTKKLSSNLDKSVDDYEEKYKLLEIKYEKLLKRVEKLEEKMNLQDNVDIDDERDYDL